MIAVEYIHPMLVHFPIVLALLLAGVDLLAWLGGRPIGGRGGLAAASCALAVLAGIAAIATYAAGDAAMDIAIDKGFPEALIETHEGLGTTAAILLAAWALLRAWLWLRDRRLGGFMRFALVLAEAGLAGLVVVTAYFGGGLVYEHGVNVAGRVPAARAAPAAPDTK